LRGGRGGSSCYVSLCTSNSTLHINSLRSTPLFIPDCPEWKQRRHSKITANVSFLVLFLSMYCLLLTIRVFCFLKNVELICLQWYRPSQIERLDTICAKCNTSSGFSVIRFHHLKRSFSPVPEGHTETVAGVL
jgi:hypothetical protein